jgi:hypothetical protein
MHYLILFKRRHGQLELYLLSNSTLYLNNIIFCYTILYFKLLLMMLLIGFYGVILFVKQFISWLFVYLQLVFVCVSKPSVIRLEQLLLFDMCPLYKCTILSQCQPLFIYAIVCFTLCKHDGGSIWYLGNGDLPSKRICI